MADKSKEIQEYLQEFHKSEGKAVSAGDLATLFNLTKRSLRSVITELRKEHYPICSSNYGYWYSTDQEDIDKTVRRLETQADNMNRAVEGLRNYRRGGSNE